MLWFVVVRFAVGVYLLALLVSVLSVLQTPDLSNVLSAAFLLSFVVVAYLRLGPDGRCLLRHLRTRGGNGSQQRR